MKSEAAEHVAEGDPVATIFVVDGDPNAREAVARIVHTMNFRCRTYASGTELLDELDDECPGCLVLDMQLPGISGMEVFKQLIARDLLLPVIFLTQLGGISMAVHILRQGAFHYLLKPPRADELWDTLNEAVAFDQNRRQRLRRRREIRAKISTLTSAEQAILAPVACGRSAREIAHRLHLTVRAVELRRSKLMRKLDVTTPWELYCAAVEAGGHGELPCDGYD